jgi:hypothetical protein
MTQATNGVQKYGGGVLVLSILGCAATGMTTRIAEEPSGEAVTYGAPRDTVYEVQLDAENQLARLSVYRSSTCDVLPVTIMQRYEEKVRGEKVVERAPLNKSQVVGKPDGSIACDQTYASNVDVMLETEAKGRFPMGTTDQLGQVSADLSQLFQVDSYEKVPESVHVILRPAQAKPTVDAGAISLGQLAKAQTRISELLEKLKEILDKDPGEVSAAEITRSYELYSQMVALASDDARVSAVSARFWELLYERKLDEARERMGKNLEALSQAKETLKVMGDAAIPIYVQVAVNSGILDRRALEWSSLRLLRALRGAPAICSAGFAWGRVPTYGWPADARLAAQYVHYGYGDGHASAIQASCRAF